MNQPQTPDNEVARLRELLQHAIENCECLAKCSSHFGSYCDCGRYRRNEEIRKELARLATAPEEPVIQENRTTEPVSEGTRIAAETRAACNNLTEQEREQAREKANEVMEWRELGPDEVVQIGDEVESTTIRYLRDEIQKLKEMNSSSIKICPDCGGAILTGNTSWGGPICYCMRKSLNTTPIVDLKHCGEYTWQKDVRDLTAAIREIRDEIQKLKETQDQHRKSLDLFCNQLVDLKQK